eukprot:Rhum_TRINITY_DN18477_c0_g1::Rhum_TRINITY_DN18477_c0_g1_i1::g.167242::m.167242/K01634/SGPL1, DPL1; sphinganine-1-phosphate aldolase
MSDLMLLPVERFNARFAGTPPVRVAAVSMLIVVLLSKLSHLFRYGFHDAVEQIKLVVFAFVRRYFHSYLGIDSAISSARDGFLKDFAKHTASVGFLNDRLPERSLSREEVLAMCDKLGEVNSEFMQGQYSGCIYHGGDGGYSEFIAEAMAKHLWTNPLHAGQFHGVRKMEGECVAMACRMFNGGAEACGTMTSGGTESILLSMRAYRELARQTRGVTAPELVVPHTAHAAFDKASDYFGIKIRKARVDPKTYKVDVAHMKSLLNSNTIAVVASAPGYPHGIVDPVTEVAALGKNWGIPVHVDACLGGFILCFMEGAGLDLDERFDFRIEGVTSISVDTHKYAFAPKGTSLILYRSAELRKYQMHSCPDWPGGIYATPTLSGSRVGSVIAGAWAAMMHHGVEGYVNSTRAIVMASRYIADEVSRTPGLHLLGKPLASVVAFSSDEFDIYRMLAELCDKGWELSSLQYPSAIHVCVTRVHTLEDMKHAKRMVADIQEVAAKLMLTKGEKATGMAALYGTTQTIPDRTIVSDVAKAYFDAYYSVAPVETVDTDDK